MLQKIALTIDPNIAYREGGMKYVAIFELWHKVYSTTYASVHVHLREVFQGILQKIVDINIPQTCLIQFDRTTYAKFYWMTVVVYRFVCT